jgi:hypothetical protein
MKQLQNVNISYLRHLVLIALMLTGCASIRLISEYDEITDRKIAELHEKFARHFVQLERLVGTDEGDYVHFQGFYDEVNADLRILRVRAGVLDKNEIMIQSLDLMEENISNLEALHKLGFRKLDEIIPIRNAFDASFSAMIKFMAALKRDGQ